LQAAAIVEVAAARLFATLESDDLDCACWAPWASSRHDRIVGRGSI